MGQAVPRREAASSGGQGLEALGALVSVSDQSRAGGSVELGDQMTEGWERRPSRGREEMHCCPFFGK